MKTLPLYFCFGVGAKIVYLMRIPEGAPIEGIGNVKNVIEELIRDIRFFELKATSASLDKLDNFLVKLKDDSNKKKLTQKDAIELQDIAEKLSPILEAESKIAVTLSLSEKRYNTEKLLNSVSDLFAKGIFNKLNDLVKYDMQEAGKCIALNRNTAAAFHSLRATEGSLKQYYFSIIKQKRIKVPMWGNMIDALKKKKTNKPPIELLEILDMIRKNYRNPTQHPDKIYNEEESQDLFNLCISVINMMNK